MRDARIITVVSMGTCLHGDNLGSLPGGQSGDMDLTLCPRVRVCVYTCGVEGAEGKRVCVSKCIFYVCAHACVYFSV